VQGSTWPELCARWISAGSFYTFSRNHNDIGGTPQELYRWPEVASAARNALSLRYQLLPYLNSQFARVHACGGTVMRPIWWNVPDDAVSTGAWACMDGLHAERSQSHSQLQLRSRESVEKAGGSSSQRNAVAPRPSNRGAPSENTWEQGLEQTADGSRPRSLHRESLHASAISRGISRVATRRGPGNVRPARSSAGENAPEDQWLWGSDVMISPILSPGVFSRTVNIPEGSAWLCWQGCPHGVHSVSSLRSDVPPSTVFTRSSVRLLPGQPSGSGWRRHLAGSTDDAPGQQRQAAAESNEPEHTGAAGSVVQVDGIELDKVPVWLRFGSIVPTSALFHAGTEASNDTSRTFEHAAFDTDTKEDEQLPHEEGADVINSSGGAVSGRNSAKVQGTGAQSFQFAVPTAEEALKSPVILLVLLEADDQAHGVFHGTMHLHTQPCELCHAEYERLQL
jgi:hypothetical protein